MKYYHILLYIVELKTIDNSTHQLQILVLKTKHGIIIAFLLYFTPPFCFLYSSFQLLVPFVSVCLQPHSQFAPPCGGTKNVAAAAGCMDDQTPSLVLHS